MADLLRAEYRTCRTIYLSWDAASWHISRKLFSHLGPSPSHVQAKIPHAVLTQSQSQARPEGTECRTRPCGRRNEATQSPLGLSANR